jgi:AraC-like DNA-binding protein
MTVREIAASLGFDNPANFGKMFKRWFGTSPGKFRKSRR